MEGASVGTPQDPAQEPLPGSEGTRLLGLTRGTGGSSSLPSSEARVGGSSRSESPPAGPRECTVPPADYMSLSWSSVF